VGAVTVCPGCATPVVAGPPPAEDAAIIDVEAQVVGAEPEPPRVVQVRESVGEEGGPRVYTRVERGPWGTARSTTVIFGNGTPGGPNCCGCGCLLLLGLAVVIFVRGCASFF
jgi:hypothetical protein